MRVPTLKHRHPCRVSTRSSLLVGLATMVKIGSSDLEVTRFCLGGNVFGWTADRDTSFAVLDAYVAAGGNFVDTADSYFWRAPGNSGGESESLIGEWMASRGNRDSVVVATKVGSWPERKGLSAKNIAEAVDDSLRRLRTDHIDLYYAHRDDPDTGTASPPTWRCSRTTTSWSARSTRTRSPRSSGARGWAACPTTRSRRAS
jgi:aryl-alcohol dehydrogenase-like predicted oxidoreductase